MNWIKFDIYKQRQYYNTLNLQTDTFDKNVHIQSEKKSLLEHCKNLKRIQYWPFKIRVQKSLFLLQSVTLKNFKKIVISGTQSWSDIFFFVVFSYHNFYVWLKDKILKCRNLGVDTFLPFVIVTLLACIFLDKMKRGVLIWILNLITKFSNVCSR